MTATASQATVQSSLAGTLFLVNPAAGGGRGGRRWRRLRETFPELDGARVLMASDDASARRELRDAFEAGGVDRLIAVGGDGTAHLAANVLLAAEDDGVLEASRVPFGLVPAGTGSDLSRHLGLPGRPAKALRQVLVATPKPLDAMVLEADDGRREFVLNIASGGLSGSVVQAIDANPRRGQLSYLQSTVQGLLKYRPAGCRVHIDGRAVERDEFLVVAVANGQFFGRGMKVAPGARSDDGRLEVVLIAPVPSWKLPWLLPQFLVGRHVHHPAVQVHPATRVRLEPEPGFRPFELDGEVFDAAAVELSIRPSALRVLR